jgi:DUF4097 and DUF4098 domain-containing protein YvlB
MTLRGLAQTEQGGMMKRKWWIVGILVAFELLVCAAIVWTTWAGRTTFEGVRFFYVADTHVEETVEKTFAVDGPAVVDAETDFGDVTVTGGEGDEVEVIARLNLWGADEEDARRQVDVQMTQEGNRITVRVVHPERIYVAAFSKGSQVDFEIRVPADASLRLVTSSGDLTVSAVAGTVELDTSFGDIEVKEVNGPVSAESSSGDVSVIGLKDGGDVEVETDFGKLALRDIAANSLTAHSDSGDIRAEEIVLDGALDLRTSFGSVTVQDTAADGLTARSDSGEIQAERVTVDGALDLATSFGDVKGISVSAASYRLHSSSGDLTLEGCSGPLDLQTDFGSIEVRDASEVQLTLTTNNGKVYFSGSLYPQGEHRVESDFGAVHLVLPADAAFDLDAETDFGSIDTGFPVTMSRFEEKHLVGEVNGGGPLLRIKTDNGNITLESAVAKSD